MADASVPTLFRSGLAPEGRCAWYLNGSRQLLEDARTIRRLGYAFRIENEGVGVGGYENVLGDVLFDVLAIFGKRKYGDYGLRIVGLWMSCCFALAQ